VQTGRHRTSFPRAPLVAIGCHGTTHGRVDGRVQYLTATFVPNSASNFPSYQQLSFSSTLRVRSVPFNLHENMRLGKPDLVSMDIGTRAYENRPFLDRKYQLDSQA
jgi:hypothetical protein